MSTPTEPPKTAPKPPPKAPNPALVAMGLGGLRAKLPSRNWTIFLTITGSFIGAVYYDRYQVKQSKQKYIDLVKHLADQPFPPNALPRKVTILLAAPPGDSITPSREHFRDYVKPILNAAAVDFDVVEGKQMGELTRKVADTIRRERKGEITVEGKDAIIETVRQHIGLQRIGDPGFVVVGRHAWKEYIRGTHEGYLGPLEDPVAPPPPAPVEDPPAAEKDPADIHDTTNKPEKEDPTKTEDEVVTPEFPSLILPEAYRAAALPDTTPPFFPPVAPIPFPHLLGFLNTPIRLYRFVTRRYMAETCFREAAAVALGVSRPFISEPEPEGTMIESEDVGKALKGEGETCEIGKELVWEEKDWPGKVWKEDRYIGVWREGVRGDERVMGRFRRFCLDSEAEVRVMRAEEGA